MISNRKSVLLLPTFLLLGTLATEIPAAVMDIEIVNTAGRIEADGTFLDPNNPGAHFALATLQADELVGATSLNELWWDLEIKVTISSDMVGQDAMIAIDKDVLNQTPHHWTDFHMTLGRGIGEGPGGFVESSETDGLFFKENPAPTEHTGFFKDPPSFDEPGAPDRISWFADPNNPDPNAVAPGVQPGETPFFWLGITVPAAFFGGPEVNNDPTMALFTLRQHASIPEPTSLLLMAIGALAWPRRRKH